MQVHNTSEHPMDFPNGSALSTNIGSIIFSCARFWVILFGGNTWAWISSINRYRSYISPKMPGLSHSSSWEYNYTTLRNTPWTYPTVIYLHILGQWSPYVPDFKFYFLLRILEHYERSTTIITKQPMGRISSINRYRGYISGNMPDMSHSSSWEYNYTPRNTPGYYQGINSIYRYWDYWSSVKTDFKSVFRLHRRNNISFFSI